MDDSAAYSELRDECVKLIVSNYAKHERPQVALECDHFIDYLVNIPVTTERNS